MASDLRSLYAQSQAAVQRGDLARAISTADEMLRVSQFAPSACGWAASLRLDARHWQQAIDIAQIGLTKGRSGALFGILGQAYLGRSELGQAESAFREAVREQPDYAPWKFHLALLLLRQEREFEAMEFLREGVALQADQVCLTRLAQLELTFSDPTSALEHAEKALEMDPSDGAAHTIAAKSLMELERDDEADAHWGRAHELAPGNREEVDLIRARFLREQGHFDRAVAALEQIVEEHPESAQALTLLTESKKTKEADAPLLRRLETLAVDERLLAAERMSLEYALGKAYDDLKQYEEAMSHFDRANAVAYEGIVARGGFDRGQYAAMIRTRKEVFSAKNLSDRLPSSVGDDTTIFVMGMIRSGTTLMEQILRRHPDVKGAGEQKFWMSIESKLVDLESRRVRPEALAEARSTYNKLLELYRGGAKRVVDKEPANLLLAGGLHMAYPGARIVYMHREAIDNALSIWTTRVQTTVPFVHHKGNLAFAIRQHEELMRHWQEVLPADRFMVVPYESLVSEQETWTRKVIDFCGLPWSGDCLSPEKSDDRVITPSLWQVRQPVYRTSVDRWKNYVPCLGEFESLRPTRA